ncbi:MULTISPECIES: hypothetical protein [Vibrio diabolicus subgroup]|uniref:hypothetical protein n=1 Tax=Vibrio diabolicus subgroup TaxID=2315253 RepID=UPI00265A750B|nr:hypothetical protein [Vibrio antiquarius]MCR9632226.1 hypothetical protein [Vibrio antiquarius]
MEKLHNSLIIFDLFKEKLERDQFLIEYSVDKTKKYGKRIKDLEHFNEDLKQSLFLKQIIDICSFLDEFKAFRSFAKDSEKIKAICRRVKPAIDRIEEVKGLREYRNALAAHNFRHEKNKDSVVLLSDHTKNPDSPNSIAEVFFLSALCSMIIEVISIEYKNELQEAKEEYWSSLDDDRDDPLRGVKNLREAYDEVDNYRLNIGLQPIFLKGEFEEFNIALKKMEKDRVPDEFELSKDRTNDKWCEVLDRYLRMRGYQDITHIKGMSGTFINSWLELYGYAVTITDRVRIYTPDDIRDAHSFTITSTPASKDKYSINSQHVYEEIMKIVTP